MEDKQYNKGGKRMRRPKKKVCAFCSEKAEKYRLQRFK